MNAELSSHRSYMVRQRGRQSLTQSCVSKMTAGVQRNEPCPCNKFARPALRNHLLATGAILNNPYIYEKA